MIDKRRSAALARAFEGSVADRLERELREDRHAAAYAELDRLFRLSPVLAFRNVRDLWLEGRLGDLSRAPQDSPWTLYLRGAIAWRADRLVEAVGLVARASAHAGYAWMRYSIAEILMRRLDMYADAEREIEGVQRAAPWLWEARCLRAEILMALGEKAPDASPAGVPPPSKPGFFAWRGAIKLWSGRAKAALADLDKAAALGNLDARGWRGGALVLLGRLDLAIADLTAVLDQDPNDPEALVWRGEAYRRAGRRAEAAADLDRAIELSDVTVWAFANRALLRLDSGDEAGSRRDFARLAPPRYKDAPDDGSGRDLGTYVFEEPTAPAARLRELLEDALRLARGCRRFDVHLNRGWMAAAGIPVPERPAPDSRLLYWLKTTGLPCPPEPAFNFGAAATEDARRALAGAL